MKYTRFFNFFIIMYLFSILSCSPSLGASWYAKSGGKSSGPAMYVTSIKILNKDVTINDPNYSSVEGDQALNFAKAKRFSVSVPYSVKSIDTESLKIEAYEDYKKQKPLKISLEIEGDSVPLVAGETVSMLLKIKDDAGKYHTEEKIISVTREMPEAVELKLLSLQVHDMNVKVVEDEKLKVDIPYSKGDTVTAGDIRATFKVGDEEKVLPVVVSEEQGKLQVGEEVEVVFSVEEKKNVYKSFSSSLLCKRLAKTSDEDEPLEMIFLSVLNIDARSGIVKVLNDVTQIVASDIVATFKNFGTLPVTLQEDIVKFDNAGNAELIIKVEGNKGQYSSWTKTVHAVKHSQDTPEDPDSPSDPTPEEPTEPEPPALENPKDENGNEKFIVKIDVKKEEIDPFDYYKADYDFPASLFGGWILNMTSMTKDNVATYAFKPGNWEGEPKTCTGPTIAEGQLNKTWDLKYYKYKNQEERWREHGGYKPSIDEKEKKRRERFIFFRFTGSASMGITLDNSMFCVDTHTKFLFYYSSPANISNFGVPSQWRDYEQPTEGSHKQFNKPFYLTDPVGYVKEDGECVIYSWCKQHIMSNNYVATEDSTYKRTASKKASGKGYSPYRDVKIKTTKTRTVKENPLYTAQKPVITKQSGALYLTVDSPDKAILSVKVKDTPKDEVLSYQWYTNAVSSQEGGNAIDGATRAEYEMEKKVIDVYCYCVVTNKNTKNNKEAKTTSQPVKVRIAKSNEDLKIDAETPIIKKHPKSAKYAFIEGKDIDVSLNVEVLKLKDKGVLSYQWFEGVNETTENETKIDNATENTYKTKLSEAGIKYYYCVVTNTNEKATGEKVVSVSSAVAKIEIEQLYELTLSCTGEGELKVFGGIDGTKTVKDGQEGAIKVKLGTDLVFIAKPKAGWKVKEWEGKATVSEWDIRTAQLPVKSKEDVKEAVGVSFEKIIKEGKLGVSEVMIQNISLGGYKSVTVFDKGPVDYTFFDFDFDISFKDDNHTDFGSLFKWKHDGGGNSNYICLYKKGIQGQKSKENANSDLAKKEDISFYNGAPALKLSLLLKKNDRGSFWAKTNDQIICNKGNGDIEFKYDELNDCWRVKDATYNIDKVTVSYNKNFTLHRGQEKLFTVIYDVDNVENHAVGKVKVVYTLSWENKE